jgi:hypothetical protein
LGQRRGSTVVDGSVGVIFVFARLEFKVPNRLINEGIDFEALDPPPEPVALGEPGIVEILGVGDAA